MKNQLCPLCDRPASHNISHDPYCKHFTCNECREFFIDASSETYLAGLVEVFKTELRAKLSAMSKACPSDCVFVLRVPRRDELRDDGHGVARTNMKAEYVKT